jgi:hypothetical protein
MAEGRPAVERANDPKQVERVRKQAEREAQWIAEQYRQVMHTPAGRAVVWDLLERCRVFESIWEPNARIHYLAGRQDFGHELMGIVLETDEELYLLMEQEARRRAKRARDANEASHASREIDDE